MDPPGTLVSEDRSAASIYVPAILAGLAVAIVGGIVWGLIVKSTDYEVGFVAWGIGFLAGLGILFATGGRRGLPLQLIAILSALLGIVIGKYLSFVWILDDLPELDVPIFSRDTVDLFFDELGVVFDWIDLLWAGLAVFSAWRALAPQPPEPVVAEGPTDEGPTPAAKP